MLGLDQQPMVVLRAGDGQSSNDGIGRRVDFHELGGALCVNKDVAAHGVILRVADLAADLDGRGARIGSDVDDRIGATVLVGDVDSARLARMSAYTAARGRLGLIRSALSTLAMGGFLFGYDIVLLAGRNRSSNPTSRSRVRRYEGGPIVAR